MALDRAAATNNANSKVLRVEHIIEDRARPSIEQMAAIAQVVDEWRAETGAHSGNPAMLHHTGVSTCSCDGPPHPYSAFWCPSTGPVTRRG